MNFKLVKGVGDYTKGEACIMSAAVATWRVQQGLDIGQATDELDCVCPVIRSFLIELNDSNLWRDDEHRTSVLTPYICKIIGTNNPDLLIKRFYILADWSVRTMAAESMRRAGFEEQYLTLSQLPEICSPETAYAAVFVANDTAVAAANARAATRTVRAAANVVVAAANAIVYTTANAAVYAVAAAAVAANADCDLIISQCCEVLDRIITCEVSV